MLACRVTLQCERVLLERKQEQEEKVETEEEEGGGSAEESKSEAPEVTNVSSVFIKYTLPIPNASENQVELKFQSEEDKVSITEEQIHEVTSSETFVRSFVSSGHSSKFSASYVDGSGETQSIQELVDLSSLLVGDKCKKKTIKCHVKAAESSSESTEAAPPPRLKRITVEVHLEKKETIENDQDSSSPSQENVAAEEEAPSYVPCGMLTSDLVDLLNPFVFKISTIESLPDRPASISQLDTQCEPVSLRYTFFDTRKPGDGDGDGDNEASTNSSASNSVEVWYRGLRSGKWASNEVGTMNYRDVTVDGVSVYFLGDRDEDEMYKHFFYGKIPIEVHDRLPTPEDLPAPVPKESSPAEENGEEPKEETKAIGSASAREAEQRTSFVCGLAHISLREFCMGYTTFDSSVNVFPYTSIRGGADLDWKTRPGRYVESGAQVTYVARVAKSLKDVGKHRYFQRAVFLFPYDENQLLRTIQELVTAANQQALHLKGTKAFIQQTLATYKFDKEQAKSTNLDVLTGFQVIDGKMRLIVVEGLKNGAMAHVRDLVEATTSSSSYMDSAKLQDKQKQEESAGRSKSKMLLFNPALCYSKRLYTSLGAQIHPIKLSAPLPHIMANCHTHSGRKVREQCREGLKRLSNLCRITWLRQADRMQLLPTSEMLNYIDKKFGGELTKTDEEGYGTDDAAQADMLKETSDLSLTHFLSSSKKLEKEESIEKKSSDSKTEELRTTRYTYSKPQLDFENKAFEEERMKRETIRKERNFLDEYIQQLPEMEKVAQSIRDEWFTWNPQRLKTFRSPLQAVKAVHAFQSASPKNLFKTKAKEKEDESTSRPEFIFPAPKSPGQYNSHPKRPTKARIEELEQPWIENEFYGSLIRYDDESDIVPFKTIMPAPAILEKNPDFFTSVHLCGEGLIKEQEAAKQQEIERWNSKVVVDNPHFYSIIKSRKQVSQTDRNEITLKGPPVKKGFRISHADPLPTSMHINDPYEEGDDKFFRRKVDPSKFKAGADFITYIHTDESKVYRPKTKK